MGGATDGVRLSNRAVILITSGLVSGILASAGLLTADTEDRYYGSTAVKDFALRDYQIKSLKEEVRSLKVQVERIDATHPPPELTAAVKEIRERLREIELRDARQGG